MMNSQMKIVFYGGTMLCVYRLLSTLFVYSRLSHYSTNIQPLLQSAGTTNNSRQLSQSIENQPNTLGLTGDYLDENSSRQLTQSNTSNTFRLRKDNTERWRHINLDRIKMTPEDITRVDETTKWWKNATESQLNHTCVNRHNYTFIINNEDLCNEDVYLVVYTHSDPEHIWQRDVIRKTWASVKSVWGSKIVNVFLTGWRFSEDTNRMRIIQEGLENESLLHHDIIQSDFMDTYFNLTYKHIMGLHWVNMFCPRATFLLKTDDDVMVNMYSVMMFLKLNEDVLKEKNAIFCHKMHKFPPPFRTRSLTHSLLWRHHLPLTHSGFRTGDYKWQVSLEEYPYSRYATFCNGVANIITQTASNAIYKASSKVPFIRMDDVYSGFYAQVSGTLLFQLGPAWPDWNGSVYTEMNSNIKPPMDYDWLALWDQITRNNK